MAFSLFRSPGTGNRDTDPLLESGLLPDNASDSSKIDAEETDSDYFSDDDRSAQGLKIKEAREKRIKEAGGWFGYLKDFRLFVPFIIPQSDDRYAQFCIFAAVICLALLRVDRVVIPWLLGIITDKVTTGHAPIKELAIYFAVDVLTGESGLDLLLEMMKIPITRYSYTKITNRAFQHVMAQSIDFHSTQDAAEVMKAVEQGFALSNILELAVFEMLPTVADTLIACVLFYHKFNATICFFLLGASCAYLAAQAYSASLTTGGRRKVTQAERSQIRKMHQAIQGWQTVAFFNQFKKEALEMFHAVNEHMSAETGFLYRAKLYNGAAELIIPITFSGLALLILKQIAAGQATPGDFVFFLQYWDSIIYPIKFLSEHSRLLVRDFVDAERLLMLFKTDPSIVDAPNAVPLPRTQGVIEFNDVSLMYDEDRPALNGISFSVSPGRTVALVGQTGAGKSSVLKLLLRLYEVTDGSISVSGHDIRAVTLSSLREAFGVVPQTPVFFNASIMENVRYARTDATDEEVYAACRGAAMHDTIMQYRKGYDTQVGERGVKLSGGEAQRLAIARVLLKNAPIVLLDEATSAVDTVTEAKVKEAFETLREGRIVIVIAHRLSTTVDADQILVFHEGQIVERGSHDELCEQKGRYWDLWEKS